MWVYRVTVLSVDFLNFKSQAVSEAIVYLAKSAIYVVMWLNE
jgi:hypothetical protein